jgi:serine/threonine-protein kinase
MVLTPGTRVGEFEVLSPLGAGGMGEVYRSRDSRLEREVALKVLPATTEADAIARKRLLREARLASKLNHPNICTIYEVGEDEGQLYIAMELVSGEALSEWLSNGPMSTDEVLALGLQMADALAHAHGNGLIHRDFKSGNVVITPEGRAKVLDFGLAARVSEEEVSEATTYSVDSLELSGKIVGTLAYMAPEQLRGEGTDARSDIWALGVVLYEMASGKRPFKGKTGFELSSEILSAAPAPLPPAPDGTAPIHLQAVIDRCLEKDPTRRFQSAAEVRDALEMIGSIDRPEIQPVHAASRSSSHREQARPIRMAVLPFANFSGDPEQVYLSDGFTQEMITQLGKLHPEGLSVIARSSVMRYRNGETPVDQIGRELNVDFVLEGSAQREEGRIRIAVELIEAGAQTQLWADSFEKEISRILSVQREVALEVAEALALKLLPDEKARLTSALTVNPEAYEAYLKGTHHWQKLTPEDLETAQRYFELALEKDPEYAPAYEGLAIVWGAREQMGIEEPQVAGPKSMEAALKAVELDPNSAQAHEALALAKTWREWDWAGAEEAWQRTFELNPNGANAHAYYAHYLAIVGRVEEAFPHSELAIELDPFNSLYHALYGAALIFARRYQEALVALQTALETQPDNPIALFTLAEAFYGGGMQDELVANQRLLIKDDPELLEAFDNGMNVAGFESAQRKVADLMAARFESTEGNVSPWFGEIIIAWRYFFAGDFDRAVDWVEVAYESHNPNLPYFVAPIYEPLYKDPRFQDLMKKMNLPTTAF